MTNEPERDCTDPHVQDQPVYLLPGRTLTSVESLVRRHNKRARARGLPATLTVAQWYRRMAESGCTCTFCGGPYESLEHITPLNMNLEGTTYENVTTACFACNEYRNIVGRALPYLNNPIVQDLLEYAEL